MHRRPWPIVLLALFQLLTPIGSVLFTALANDVSFSRMFWALWRHAGFFDKTAIFYGPIILAFLIYFTKKIGLYLVAVAVLINFTLNIVEWTRVGDLSQLWMLIAASLLNLALIAYLMLPTVREIFLNPTVRWWERDPRYVVNLSGQVLKDEVENSCEIQDVSFGGASLECAPGKIKRGDIVYLKFKYKDRLIGMQCEVMYERTMGGSSDSKYGLRRLASSLTGETMMIQDLIRDLKKARVPITRPDADTKKSFAEWAKKAVREPRAWVPESAPKPKTQKTD